MRTLPRRQSSTIINLGADRGANQRVSEKNKLSMIVNSILEKKGRRRTIKVTGGYGAERSVKCLLERWDIIRSKALNRKKPRVNGKRKTRSPSRGCRALRWWRKGSRLADRELGEYLIRTTGRRKLGAKNVGLGQEGDERARFRESGRRSRLSEKSALSSRVRRGEEEELRATEELRIARESKRGGDETERTKERAQIKEKSFILWMGPPPTPQQKKNKNQNPHNHPPPPKKQKKEKQKAPEWTGKGGVR